MQKAGSPVLARSPQRQDIQGLRALLMVQVLLFHAWFIGSPIGVDAFIMISAFLMTRSFLRRVEGGAMPHLLERWANTFKRLIPPLGIVVAGTLVATFALFPVNRWGSLIDQSYASLTYWQNWLLASLSVDYYAQDHALASPLQHLWSMSMQGQMFLAWPVVMTLGVLVARKMKASPRLVVFALFTLIAVTSLGWLMFFAPTEGSVYFDTRARIWEFAVGSAVAAIAPYIPLRKVAKSYLTWLALGVLILFSLVLIGSYPGPWALVPLLATSAIMLYGDEGFPFNAGRLLAVRPLVFLGDMSYAVYLIHWPIFVFYLHQTGRERLGVWDGLALMAVSVGLSHLLTRYVDQPLRTSDWVNASTENKTWTALVALGAALVFVFSGQMSLQQVTQTQQRETRLAELVAARHQVLRSWQTATKADIAMLQAGKPIAPEDMPPLEGFPGAQALFYEGPLDLTAAPIPAPTAAEGQWATYPGKCSPAAGPLLYEYQNAGCTSYGDPEKANATVLMAGGSHVEQIFMPILRPYLKANNYYGESVLKMACHWTWPNDKIAADCSAHNANVIEYVDADPPDYVFLLVTSTSTNSSKERMIPGIKKLVKHLTDQGITVIGTRDNLRSSTNLFECEGKKNPTKPGGGCMLKQKDFFAKKNPAAELNKIPGFHFVDTLDLYCQDGKCPTIIGNVKVYLDTNHLTEAYAETMSPIFIERLEEALAN